jgi:signal transduction histidine kinase/anti-sigma regulatory factor (Ser/Thr protein kinase)
MKKNSNIYAIRPAGRHILTIGRDLIHDQYAAIVELVKNAYDADSPDVNIIFNISDDRKTLTTIIKDHGHGMSKESVLNEWLVPSTANKLNKRNSPKGRTMQGRKGVGRYAASILGDDLHLETVTSDGEKTSIYLEWKDFENADYLDEVEVIVDVEKTDDDVGTTLTITGGGEFIEQWDKNQSDKLKFELKKLISPFNLTSTEVGNTESFDINIVYENYWEGQLEPHLEKIESYPIVKLFDYRISGNIDSTGKGKLTYENQKSRNTIIEQFDFELREPTNCGELSLDIRVYDREADAISQLIKRGLKDERGDYLGKLQARELLNKVNGIGVYRNGFRVRPLGDADFDWLKLNEQRIQNPSLKIGSNQVVGYIEIQSEEQSNLQEKSARDGLRENIAYKSLRHICLKVISELESKRFEYRKKAGLSRTAIKIERELEGLFSFEELKVGIKKALKKSGLNKKTTDEIIKAIDNEEENKNKIVDEIRKTVAIYQGQATLGKIINVILHEGRRPLSFFKNQISNLNVWIDDFKTNHSIDALEEIITIIGKFELNANTLVGLFNRIDPLAAGNRGKKTNYNLKSSIKSAANVFENELINKKILLEIDGPENLMFYGWERDIYLIVTNLIDNSIFWIEENKSTVRKIRIEISEDEGNLKHIDYCDTGTGIESHLLENDVIFEPEFSTKPNGTGLGLAIAGEASSRNNLELIALDSEQGAYFRLQNLTEDTQDE